MKTGDPPTALKARTGEFTPPAMMPRARANAEMDRSRRKVVVFLDRIDARKDAFVGKTHALGSEPFDNGRDASRSGL
jgi:hypothetical protein